MYFSCFSLPKGRKEDITIITTTTYNWQTTVTLVCQTPDIVSANPSNFECTKEFVEIPLLG